MEHGREVQDPGQRDAFMASLKAAEGWPALFPRCAELEKQVEAVDAREDPCLEAGDYDLVILNQDDKRRQLLLSKKYERLGGVTLPYPQGMSIQTLLAYQLKRAHAL